MCVSPCEKKGKWLFRGLKKVVFLHVAKKNGCFRANLTAVILDNVRTNTKIDLVTSENN